VTAKTIVHTAPPPSVGRIIHYYGPCAGPPTHAGDPGGPLAAIVTEVSTHVVVETFEPQKPPESVPAIGVTLFPRPSQGNARSYWLPAREGVVMSDGSYWTWPPRV
jgi:hypothetical protein